MTLRMIVVLSLAGCVSDSGLSSLLPQDDPAGVGTSGGGARPPIGSQNRPNGGGGVWGNLDPGDLPDVYFAVAYAETPYGWYTCDAEHCDAEADVDVLWYPYGDVKYAVIDLRGQVVWDVPAFADGTWREHLALAAGGPGQFTVTSRPWEVLDTADEDGFAASTNWEAWRFDAVAMNAERVAHFDLARALTRIDRTGAEVDLAPPGGTLDVGTFPTDPERALFFGAPAWPCGAASGVRGLKSVHLTDPEAPALAFDPASLAVGDGPWSAWAFEASADEHADDAALLGLTSWDCATGAATAHLAAWSAVDGVRWSESLALPPWPWSASFDPTDGGGGLVFGYDPTDGRAIWRIVDEGGTRRGDLGDALYNWRPGPLLERSSGTFVAVGSRPDDGFDTLAIVHDGRVVWRIEDLRFGMGRQDVAVFDVVMIPM